MLTDLQRRKLIRMFTRLDGDHDGVLERGDYDRICGRLLRALEAQPGSQEAAEITASYATEWSELQAEADSSGGRVTLEGWLAYRDAQLGGPDAFEVMIDPYVETVFALLDRDGDGRLSSDDVRRYFGLYAMPAGELEEILGKIDPDRRGWFSRGDIGQLAREFYFSSDESAPGSWLLGRF
jgi:Ca2+-binding EF-hand superfamily protein